MSETKFRTHMKIESERLLSSAERPQFRGVSLMELDISADKSRHCKGISYWQIPFPLSGISLSRQIYCCLDGDGFEAKDDPHLLHCMSERTTLQMAFNFNPGGDENSAVMLWNIPGDSARPYSGKYLMRRYRTVVYDVSARDAAIMKITVSWDVRLCHSSSG
jgi:hypothetical protein